MDTSTSAANQKHWSSTAKAYSVQPGFEKVSAQIRSNLNRNASWIGLSADRADSTTIIDYACGPGTAGLSLLDYASTIIGIDSAQGMIEQFQARCEIEGLDPSKIRGVHADLLQDDPSSALQSFYGTADVVLCSVGFHHFDHPETTIHKFLRLLKSGGRLVIIDFLKHSGFAAAGITKDGASTIGHGAGNGFSSDDIKHILEAGGCVNVEVREWQPEDKGGEGQFVFTKNGQEKRFDCFTCRGTKP